MQQDLYAREVKMRGSKMLDFLVLHFVTCLCNAISTQSDVRMPPCITKSHPEKSTVYERRQTLSLECSAVGTPAVRYEWRKNGFPLNTTLSRISIESDGAITINRATETDEGHYQCFAKNRYGTALSNMIDVRMAFLDSTAGPPTVHRKTVVEGRPFYIQADRDRSFPLPRYYWSKAQDVNRIFTPLLPSKRIQMAENGDLHFAHALRDDDHGDNIYSCTIFNPYLDIDTRGCYTQLTVTRNSTGTSRFAPILAFSSTTETVALTGENVTLRCFFYGNPEPTISWIRPAKPVGKYSLSTYDKELTINSVTASDEGDFICTGSNSKGTIEHSLHIRVEAKPEFKNAMDGPYNVNITEEESVTFNCNASAKPEAMIVWLQNGQPINTDNPPERFVFSNDNKSLTIRNVCRDCKDRERQTDLTVIQCNASNVHGYAFASGYLNVLKKTALAIRGSKQISVDFLEEKQYVIQCIATSDPSRPPTVRWYKTEPFGDLVRDEPPYIYVAKEFLILMVYPNCSSHCAKYLGEYRCVGDDGYSRGNQTITLNYQYKPPTETVIQKEETWALWKIFLCAGGFGFILFLVGLFVGLRSKRRFGGVNRRMVDRKMPNPNRRSEFEESDSVDLPLTAAGKTIESMPGECSVYGHAGYDSIDQVLREVAQRERTLPNLPDVPSDDKYETIDVPQKEAISTDNPFLEDTMCGDKGYSIPFDDVAKGGKIDEDTVSGENGYSVVIEEVANDGKIDEQHVHVYESVKSESERFPKSNDRSEPSPLPYLDLNPEEVNQNFYSGKSELNSKETNSYLVLFAEEVNPCLDPTLRETDTYLDLVSEEPGQFFDRGNLDLDRKELEAESDLRLKEGNLYLEIIYKEGKTMLEMGSKKENSYTQIGSTKLNPSLEKLSKEENYYMEIGSKEANPRLLQKK